MKTIPSNTLISSPPEPNRVRKGGLFGNSPLLALLTSLGLAGVVLVIFLLSGRVAQEAYEGMVFTIPAGASQTVARPGFDSAIPIPTDIRFDSPAEAVITIKNLDSVTQRAGPFLVGAGQTFTQRFPDPGRYPIVCTVDPLESVVVTVEG
jgi:hypothetical protein